VVVPDGRRAFCLSGTMHSHIVPCAGSIVELDAEITMVLEVVLKGSTVG
jgi:hypothetical protein